MAAVMVSAGSSAAAGMGSPGGPVAGAMDVHGMALSGRPLSSKGTGSEGAAPAVPAAAATATAVSVAAPAFDPAEDP